MKTGMQQEVNYIHTSGELEPGDMFISNNQILHKDSVYMVVDKNTLQSYISVPEDNHFVPIVNLTKARFLTVRNDLHVTRVVFTAVDSNGTLLFKTV